MEKIDTKKPVVIIQARMGSTRLPNKIMLNLAGKPVLWHVAKRASLAKNVGGVIIATTENEEDNVIRDFCERDGINYFRGSEDDVLDRYYQCAKHYGICDIVRITADCPLHDPAVIDLVVGEYLKGGYDYVANTIEYTFPDGMDVEVFSFRALERAWKNAQLISEREHVTPYLRKQENVRKKNVYSTKGYPVYRLTLDNPEDYELITKIYEGIGKELFGLDEIHDFLQKNPELLKLNQHIDLNEGYAQSLREDGEYLKKTASRN